MRRQDDTLHQSALIPARARDPPVAQMAAGGTTPHTAVDPASLTPIAGLPCASRVGTAEARIRCAGGGATDEIPRASGRRRSRSRVAATGAARRHLRRLFALSENPEAQAGPAGTRLDDVAQVLLVRPCGCAFHLGSLSLQLTPCNDLFLESALHHKHCSTNGAGGASSRTRGRFIRNAVRWRLE